MRHRENGRCGVAGEAVRREKEGESVCVREREGGRYATAACVRLCAEARGKVSGCRVHLTKLLSTKSNETLWTGHEKTVTVQWDSTVGKKGKAHYVAQIAFFDD